MIKDGIRAQSITFVFISVWLRCCKIMNIPYCSVVTDCLSVLSIKEILSNHDSWRSHFPTLHKLQFDNVWWPEENCWTAAGSIFHHTRYIIILHTCTQIISSVLFNRKASSAHFEIGVTSLAFIMLISNQYFRLGCVTGVDFGNPFAFTLMKSLQYACALATNDSVTFACHVFTSGFPLRCPPASQKNALRIQFYVTETRFWIVNLTWRRRRRGS